MRFVFENPENYMTTLFGIVFENEKLVQHSPYNRISFDPQNEKTLFLYMFLFVLELSHFWCCKIALIL
jgi:hypothetical protein